MGGASGEVVRNNNVKVGLISFGESEKRDFKSTKRNYVPTVCGIHEPWSWQKRIMDRPHKLNRAAPLDASVITADVIGAL